MLVVWKTQRTVVGGKPVGMQRTLTVNKLGRGLRACAAHLLVLEGQSAVCYCVGWLAEDDWVRVVCSCLMVMVSLFRHCLLVVPGIHSKAPALLVQCPAIT